MREFAVAAALSVVLSFALANKAIAKSTGPKRSFVSEVIVHATGGPACLNDQVVFSPAGTLEGIHKFFASHPIVSIHYIIDKDGKTAAIVPENEIAYHAIGHNDQSIGIELINAGDGIDKFPKKQISGLVKLLRSIRRRHQIGYHGLLRHSDVDFTTFACAGETVRRKQDPGAQFPWEKVRRLVFPKGPFAGVLKAPRGNRGGQSYPRVSSRRQSMRATLPSRGTKRSRRSNPAQYSCWRLGTNYRSRETR